MLKNILEQELTTEQRQFAEEWLSAHTYMIAELGNETEFPEHRLLWLLKLELENKQRESLLKRLFARHGKLRNRREWGEIRVYIGAT